MRSTARPGMPVVACRVLFSAKLLATILVAASCGPSASERLESETLAGAAPVVESFASDIEAGRYDEALRRTTRGFQSAATAAAVQSVHGQMRRAVGAPKSRTPRAVEDLSSDGDPAQARSAVIVLDGAFERSAAEIRARVQRDSTGGWIVDSYEVKSGLFTFTFRK
ncbi:MAG: hypothetical protein K8T90_13990 [Planctomycetes bacterium]|nr:hypothetical protein [Planctomycetota bacterium]